VLVLRPGALGDTLLALPALRALGRAYGVVTLAAHAGAASLLATCGEVRRGIAFDDPSLAWLFTGQAIPKEDVVAWMNAAGAPGLRHALLVAPSRPDKVEHCARYLLRSLSRLGVPLDWDDSPLRVSRLRSEEVFVHPGSGSPAKNWPPERFAKVVRALDAPVRLIVGEADREAANAVELVLGHPLPRLEGIHVEELASRLAGCRGYVGNDSGVSHLAGLCGARTFALFGPSNPEIWCPIGPNVQALPFETDPAELARLLT
jgi:heptosyltransferase III